MANDNQPLSGRGQRVRELRIGAVLLAGCIIGVIALLPYQLHLMARFRTGAAAEIPPLPVLISITLFTNIIVFGLAIAIGLWLRRWTQLPMPWLDAYAARHAMPSLAPLALAGAIGLATGLALRALDAAFFLGLVSFDQPPLWTRILICLYGGINEEVFLRLCVMSIFTAVLVVIARRQGPNAAIRWTSVILAALLFAAGHLPVTEMLTPITPSIVARAFLLNGIAGMVFGWICWKRGLEAAIVAHAATDVGLHVLA
jgi:hypothetical protein